MRCVLKKLSRVKRKYREKKKHIQEKCDIEIQPYLKLNYVNV